MAFILFIYYFFADVNDGVPASVTTNESQLMERNVEGKHQLLLPNTEICVPLYLMKNYLNASPFKFNCFSSQMLRKTDLAYKNHLFSN